MRTKAALLTLVLVSSALAGCTGDPDGGGNDEFDAETLQGMIESGLADFMNNTTVEITNVYYTNETSTTTNNVNGSSYASSLHTMMGQVPGESWLMIGNGSDGSHLALLVREDGYSHDAASGSAMGLSGANICVSIGTLYESVLVDYFSSYDISFTSVPVADASEATAKLIDGSCDAMVGFLQELQEKSNTLDNDGSIAGGTWVTNSIPYYGMSWDYGYGMGGSSANFTIQQESGFTTRPLQFYAAITLTGYCVNNCSEDSPVISHSYTTNRPSSGVSTCQYNITESSSGYWSFVDQVNLFFPGLECQYTFRVVEDWGISGSEWSSIPNWNDYEFFWSDWTYLIHWESLPVTVHE